MFRQPTLITRGGFSTNNYDHAATNGRSLAFHCSHASLIVRVVRNLRPKRRCDAVLHSGARADSRTIIAPRVRPSSRRFDGTERNRYDGFHARWLPGGARLPVPVTHKRDSSRVLARKNPGGRVSRAPTMLFVRRYPVGHSLTSLRTLPPKRWRNL